MKKTVLMLVLLSSVVAPSVSFGDKISCSSSTGHFLDIESGPYGDVLTFNVYEPGEYRVYATSVENDQQIKFSAQNFELVFNLIEAERRNPDNDGDRSIAAWESIATPQHPDTYYCEIPNQFDPPDEIPDHDF